MLTEDKITEIFVMADEFCKIFNAMLRRRGLSKPHKNRKRDYHRDCRLSDAEIIVIMIMFHSSNHKCLKHFYLNERFASGTGNSGILSIPKETDNQSRKSF